MNTIQLECGLTVIYSRDGAVLSNGAKVAICESDGETPIESCLNVSMAYVRASEIVAGRRTS